MPINTRHSQYTDLEGDWQKCRDVIAGSKAIKAKKTKYLLKHQLGDEEYNDYRMRALFYNATARTQQGLTGAVFRKDPQVSPEYYPSEDENYFEDVSLDNIPLNAFCKVVFNEVMATGRYGVLTEYPREQIKYGSDGEEVDRVPPVEDRPYWVGFEAEHITNWRTARVNGNTVLQMVVLRIIDTQPSPDDEYEFVEVEKYWELYLDEEGYYAQRIWVYGEENWIVEEEILPVKEQKRIDSIPFVFFSSEGLSADAKKPPLLDLAEVNISHYCSSADLEHARHWTALPMLYVFSDALKKDMTINFGSSEALIISDSSANAGFIEYEGKGVEALENALKEKEEKMAAIGARLLDEPKGGVEKPEAMIIRLSGEQSFLQATARSVSQGLTLSLRKFLWWAGASDAEVAEANIKLNDDYLAAKISPAEMKELVLGQQAGLVSKDTFVYNMKKGEILPPGRTIEEEQALIDADDSLLVDEEEF